MDVGVAHEMIDQSKLRAPIVRETAEVGQDEINVRVLLGEKLGRRRLSHYIVQHRESKYARHFADLAGDPRVVPMQLDADEPILLHGGLDKFSYPAAVALGMNERKAIQPIRATRNHASNLAVGRRIIGVEGGENNRPIDAGAGRALQMLAQWRRGVPGSGQAITGAGVAVAVDDHDWACPGGSTRTIPAGRPPARLSR